jgi:hypothetical protein
MMREKKRAGENENVLGLGLISGVISVTNDFYFFSLCLLLVFPPLL